MDDDNNTASNPPLTGQRLLALALLSVMLLELLARITGLEAVRYLVWAALLVTMAATRNRFGGREYYLVGLCLVLTLLVVLRADDPASTIGVALDQATFLMAFILLLGLLHEAASTSPSVAACGAYMTRQPPGRRYPALYLGTGIMAVLFNIGMVSFLVPLIQKGIKKATPGHPLNPIREQRQVSALLRGFATSVMWSPTAIAPLALMELIPGTDRKVWIGLGFMIFILLMIVGAIEDKVRFRTYRPTGPRQHAEFPVSDFFRFLAACVWLFAMAAAFSWGTGDTIVFGLMMACPFMLFGWVYVQYAATGENPRRETGERVRSIIWDNLPTAAPVAVTLACSGFVGRATAALVPAEEIAGALGFDTMPDFLLLSLIPIALSLLSLLALSPIMMAVFFGSIFGQLPEIPANPTLLALSISCGWALSMTFSPFATVVLMVARVGRIPAGVLTWRWNFVYSALAALTLFPVFYLLTGGN